MPPNRVFVASSLAVALLVRQFNPNYTSVSSLICLVLTAFGVQFALWLVWRWLVYPKLFSPLRNLPQPQVSGTQHFISMPAFDIF